MPYASNDADAADKLMYSQDAPAVVQLRQHVVDVMHALMDCCEVNVAVTDATADAGSDGATDTDTDDKSSSAYETRAVQRLIDVICNTTGGWVMLHSLFYRPIVHATLMDSAATLQPLYSPLFAFVVNCYVEYAITEVVPAHDMVLLDWLDANEMQVTDYNTRLRVQAMDTVLGQLHHLLDDCPWKTPTMVRTCKVHAWILQEYIQRLWCINDHQISVHLLPYLYHTARHLGLLLVQTVEMQRLVECESEWFETSARAGTPVRQRYPVCPNAPAHSWGMTTPDADDYANIRRELFL